MVKPTDDEKCACSEHLAVFQTMKLLGFQEMKTLLAPYFLQKGHFFIFFRKNTCFFKQSDRFWWNATSRQLCFFWRKFHFSCLGVRQVAKTCKFSLNPSNFISFRPLNVVTDKEESTWTGFSKFFSLFTKIDSHLVF